MKKLILLIMLLLPFQADAWNPLVVGGSGTGGSACTGTLVESNTTENAAWKLRDDAARTMIAQTFLTTEANTRCQVILQMRRNSTVLNGNVWIELYATSAGAPTGSVIVTSSSIDTSTLTTSMLPYTFSFAAWSPSDATTYAIAVAGSFAIHATNYAWVRMNNADGYGADGVTYDWSGSAWSVANANYDLYFKVNK